MRLNILFILFFLSNALLAQHHVIESPLDLVNELKKIQKNWKDNPDYYKSPIFEFVIDLSVNQEDSKNYKKHEFESLDSLIEIVDEKFTGSISIKFNNGQNQFVSFKSGILHGKYELRMYDDMILNAGVYNMGVIDGEWLWDPTSEGADLVRDTYNNGKLIKRVKGAEGIDQQELILGEDEISIDWIANHSTTTHYTDSDTIVESLSNTGYEPIWSPFKSIYELRKNDKLIEKKETKYHVNGKIFSETHIIYGDKTLKTEKYWNESGRLTKEEKYENGVLIKE